MKLVRTLYGPKAQNSNGVPPTTTSTSKQHFRWVYYENPTSMVKVKYEPTFEPEIDKSFLPRMSPEEDSPYPGSAPPSYTASVQDSFKNLTPSSFPRKSRRASTSKPYERRNNDNSSSSLGSSSSSTLSSIDSVFQTLHININNAWNECRTVISKEMEETERCKSHYKSIEKERDELVEQLGRLGVQLESPLRDFGNDTATRFSEIGPRRTRLMRRAVKLDRTSMRTRARRSSDELDFYPHDVGDDSNDVACVGTIDRGRRHHGDIGIEHVDLLYTAQDGRLFCKACCENAQKYDRHDLGGIRNFMNDESWTELRHHYVMEHPDECRDIGSLSRSQISGLRQHLMGSSD